MINNLRFVSFSSTRTHGQMSSARSFYPEDMSSEERFATMKLNKNNFASEFGLDYRKIFIPIQKSNNCNDKYEDGKTLTITPEIVQSYDDLYDFDYHCDIAKVTSETPNVAVAYPVADCAVIKAINVRTKEAVMSHCGGEYIDRWLPMQTIDALGGNEKDIHVFISPMANELFYEDGKNLKWALNRDTVWKDCIEEELNGEFVSLRVNVYKALKRQLLERKVLEEQLVFSPFDTTKSDNFYSNSMQRHDKSYLGRFLSGVAIVEDNEKLVNVNKSYIKVI